MNCLLQRRFVHCTSLFSKRCKHLVHPALYQSHRNASVVLSLLKNPKLDPDHLTSYRPISNLTFTSKLVERVVAARFMKHIDDHTLLPARQSAYRRFHSTQTAIAAVYNDLIRAADADQSHGACVT